MLKSLHRAPFVRSPYNYDADQASKAAGFSCIGPSKTVQSFKDECDINVIVKQFGLTGVLPVGVRTPTYEDFTAVVDYHTAMNAIRASKDAFMQMPANIRYRFNNDPQAFLEFCSDDKNIAEARSLGLVPPEPLNLNLPVQPPPKEAM